MPPPSSIHHLPASHPAVKQRPRSPSRILADYEAQWLFTEAELANTPSIQDGMSQAEEKSIRAKGVNFIVQVGILLKLPQLTLSTASIFFQRFLMRASLKQERNGIPKLHHYQAAGVALFLATKVEESCRKLRDLILALCRIAQKNPNLIVDEQSKDWWRWRDCLLLNEDVMMEALCFDFTVESPHRQLFGMLKYNGVEHNKRLRNAAWGFVTDSNNTQLCLLFNSRTIAVASLYAACRYCEVQLSDDAKARPWWEAHNVRLKDIRRAMEYMHSNYDHAANKINGFATSAGQDGNSSIYLGLSPPITDVGNDSWDSTRMKSGNNGSGTPLQPAGSERRSSNASSVGVKRGRDEDTIPPNGGAAPHSGAISYDTQTKRPRLNEATGSLDRAVGETAKDGNGGEVLHGEEIHNIRQGDNIAEQNAIAASGTKGAEEGEVSEEGEVEE